MSDASETTHALPNPADPDTPILSVNMTGITKLTTTNYIAWSLQVRLFLGGHAFSSFIDATATAPPATITTDTVVSSNPKYISWIRQDQLIFASLLGTISQPLQSLVTSASTTFEAWTILAKTYGTPSRGHIKQLKDQLKKTTKGSRTIDDFMQMMKAKADELSLLGKPVDQEDLSEFIIDGLPEEYRALCDAIQNRDTPISFEEFHEKLRNREADVLCRVSPVEVFPATAQVANFRQRPSNNNIWQPAYRTDSRNQSSDNRSQQRRPYLGRCQACGKPGHSAQRCYQFRLIQNQNPSASHVNVNSAPLSDGLGTTEVETKELEECKRLILGGVEVEGSGVTEEVGTKNVKNEELEADKGLRFGSVDVGRSEVDENGALEEVKDGQKMKIEKRESLSPTIEADMRKVSLEGPADVSVADHGFDVKTEAKNDEAESDSSSESESESESSLSEASSSEPSSSSDDDDVKDGVVRRNAESMEEGEIMEEDVEQMVAWSDDEEEVVKGPIRSKNEIIVS